MKAIERAKKHGLTELEYRCMKVLNTKKSSTLFDVLCKLKGQEGWAEIDQVFDSYPVYLVLTQLIELGIARRVLWLWDDGWWLTGYGEDLLRKFNTDGDARDSQNEL